MASSAAAARAGTDRASRERKRRIEGTPGKNVGRASGKIRTTARPASTRRLPDFLIADRLGEILLVGHRVTLDHIVRRNREGETPDDILADLDSLEPELLAKVLAFYDANRAEVNASADETAAEIERQVATARRPDWPAILARFAALKAATANRQERIGERPA